jgi:hypothetical protein
VEFGRRGVGIGKIKVGNQESERATGTGGARLKIEVAPADGRVETLNRAAALVGEVRTSTTAFGDAAGKGSKICASAMVGFVLSLPQHTGVVRRGKTGIRGLRLRRRRVASWLGREPG